MPLTDAAVRNAKPKTKAFNLYDTGGLYLKVSPSGGKYWRLKYRFNGQEKRIALGVFPEISLKAARDSRDAERKLLAEGVDPSQNRKTEKSAQADRAANGFEQVTREWFAKFSPSWVPEHATRKIRLFERNIFPWIGQRPIAEITAPELLTVLRRIEERGALVMQRRGLVYSKQVFAYAIASGYTTTDPSSALSGALPTAEVEHFAAVTKPDDLAPILRTLDGYEGTFPVRCALRLMPLLAVRPGELRKAEWADIDLDAAQWCFRKTKIKKTKKRREEDETHVVPLSKQALKVLRELEALTGQSKYVFPGARTGDRPMSDATVLAAMRRMDIPADEVSGHGFRAVLRTIGAEVLKFPVDLLEHQLGHMVKDPLGRAYNRTSFLPERRVMMQQWSDYIDALKSGKVVEFTVVA